MVPIDRPSIDMHFFTARYLTQKLPAPMTYVTTQHLITVLRRPHKVVFTVPDCMASALVMFHLNSIYQSPIRRLKAGGLQIP